MEMFLAIIGLAILALAFASTWNGEHDDSIHEVTYEEERKDNNGLF